MAGSKKEDPAVERSPRRRRRIVLGVTAIAVVCVLAIILFILTAPGLWTAYSDGGDLYLRESDPAVRHAAWESIRLFGGKVNDAFHNVGCGLSETGTVLVFSRRPPKKKDADLFITRFDGYTWTDPAPLTTLNTTADELAPTLSRDGKRIYFHSNRRGGRGGYDIYSSHRHAGRWPKPVNLGKKINSEFDECDPALSPDEGELIFASNRPKDPEITEIARREMWRAVMVERAEGDFDLFAAENVIVPARANPLRDQSFRQEVIVKLGGSPETEKAVEAGLHWLVKNQEPDGRWSCARHGGQAGHDNAATGFAILSLLGWGARHDAEGPYREPLAKAVTWLAGRAGKNGDLTAGLSNGMYDQGIATIALAEAYELTRDPALLEPLKQATAFIVKAQHKSLGGWRYLPTSTDCDTSVVGWQVMALWSARNAGIDVPDASFTLAAKWMDRAGGGKHKGLYGYTGPGKSGPMTAEGMFVRQLIGAARREARQKESAAYIASLAPKPGTKSPNLYLIYYGSLALHQQQGTQWRKWNRSVKPLLLELQGTKGAETGTWRGGTYASSYGRVIATAMAALSLEVYYRYLPMYNVKGRGPPALKKTTKKVVTKKRKPRLPRKLVPLTARRVPELCSDANDRAPEFTQHGDYVYFSSDRSGGQGDLDLYRARILHGEIGRPGNLGPHVNSPAHDTDPSLASHGFELVFASSRAVGEHQPMLLYHTVAREVQPVHDAFVLTAIMAFLGRVKWWLIGLVLGIAALVLLVGWYRRVADDPRLGRLAKCMLGSVGVHAMLLVVLSVWMIGRTLTEEAAEPMQVSIDANALANEKLALALREQVSTMDTTPEPTLARMKAPSMTVPDIEPAKSSPQKMAESKFKVDPAELEANAREVEVREAAERARPSEEPRVRVGFKLPKVTLEERPAPSRKRERAREVEVAVNHVRPKTEASEFARPEIDREFTPPPERAASAADAASPADLKPVAASARPAPAPGREPEPPRPAPAERATPRLRFAAAPELESAQPRPTSRAAEPVAVRPARAGDESSASAKVERSAAGSLRSAARMARADLALAAAVADAQPAARPAGETVEAPSAPPARAPHRVKFKQPSVRLESVAPRRTGAAQAPAVTVAATGMPGDASARAQAESDAAGAMTMTGDAARADVPTPGVQASEAPVARPMLRESAAEPSARAARETSRVAFRPAGVTFESAAPKRPSEQPATSPAVAPTGTRGGASARAAAAQDVASALTAMGQVARADVPTPGVQAAQPSVRAVAAPDAAEAIDTVGPRADRDARVRFKPSGLKLETAQPRRRGAGTAAEVGVRPATTHVGGSARVEAGPEPGSALRAVGEMARADVAPSHVRVGDPAARTVDRSAPEAAAPLGGPEGRPRGTGRVAFAPSGVRLESAAPRGRGPAGVGVAVAPVGPAGGIALGRPDRPVAGALASAAGISESRLPRGPGPVVKEPGRGRVEGAAESHRLPSGRPVDRAMLRMRAVATLEGRGEGPPDYMRLRDKENRSALLTRLGTDPKGEAGVRRALDWFTRHQEPDGRWSCEKSGGTAAHDNAATGLAILCYYGWGVKHTEKGGDDAAYQEPLARGVKWLAGRVGKDGDLTGGLAAGMYDQGIATMALAEAYGLTGDEALRPALERAVGYILRAQNKRHGGWRYKPDSSDGDTSIFGWQIMALTSARMAGLDVPQEALDRSKLWLDRVATGRHKGRYGYTDKGAKHAMTAEAMFCWQLMGRAPTDPRMKESAEFIEDEMPGGGRPNYYYWYYACLALYQHQGPVWEKWNERMRRALLPSQITGGEHAGSWAPNGAYRQGGRVVSTALATLSLEVYYRYLPMYAIPTADKPGD